MGSVMAGISKMIATRSAAYTTGAGFSCFITDNHGAMTERIRGGDGKTIKEKRAYHPDYHLLYYAY